MSGGSCFDAKHVGSVGDVAETKAFLGTKQTIDAWTLLLVLRFFRAASGSEQ